MSGTGTRLTLKLPARELLRAGEKLQEERRAERAARQEVVRAAVEKKRRRVLAEADTKTLQETKQTLVAVLGLLSTFDDDNEFEGDPQQDEPSLSRMRLAVVKGEITTLDQFQAAFDALIANFPSAADLGNFGRSLLSSLSKPSSSKRSRVSLGAQDDLEGVKVKVPPLPRRATSAVEADVQRRYITPKASAQSSTSFTVHWSPVVPSISPVALPPAPTPAVDDVAPLCPLLPCEEQFLSSPHSHLLDSLFSPSSTAETTSTDTSSKDPPLPPVPPELSRYFSSLLRLSALQSINPRPETLEALWEALAASPIPLPAPKVERKP